MKTYVTSIRMPENLYEVVKKIANDEKRSISSQCLVFIEKGLKFSGIKKDG